MGTKKKKKVTLKDLKARELKLVKRIAFHALELSKWSWVLSGLRSDIERMMRP